MAATMEMVGEYRLFHMIRAGATFEIWAVRHRSETQPYAVKLLKKGPKFSRAGVAELRHEFNVGKKLVHPAVIKTLDFSVEKQGAYLRMELFKHLNIKQQMVITRQNPQLKTALTYRIKDILVNCSSGIAHLHDQGWVHRDIKPDNFLLNDASEVRLIDFTIAAKASGGMLNKLLGIKGGTTAGTHSYMAPQQIRKEGVDPRDDIYSFGCMVHEMLAGSTPFTANSPSELLQKHLRAKPPSLTVADKNIRPEFADFVTRMLAKDRNTRPDSMKEVMMELKTQRVFYNAPDPPEVDLEQSSAKADMKKG